MKQFILVFALVFLVAQYAGAQQSFGGGGHLGLVLSSLPDPLGEYYGIGFNFGGHSDYNIMKYVSVRMNVDYTILSFDSKKFVDGIAKKYNVAASDLKMEGLGINMFSFTVNGLGKIPTKTLVTPYGILGLGIHILSMSDPKVTYGTNDVTQTVGLGKDYGETDFGINFGAGAEFSFSGFKAFFEFKYVLIFTKEKSSGMFPITIGFGI